jgi:transcriptional regulator with XRE-family HTH domain
MSYQHKTLRHSADQYFCCLATYGSRRVPGLRREEVAVLAGVSVPYYTGLERSDMNGVSDSVLEALARALQLDEPERAHLFDFARAAQPNASPRRRPSTKQRVRPAVQHILDAMTTAGQISFRGHLSPKE